MASDEHKRARIQELNEEMNAIHEAIGIERGLASKAVIYNEPAAMVVVSVQRFSEELYERKLFFRHISERTYVPITTPSSDIHYTDPITSPELPFIYFADQRVSKSTGPGWGSDWLSVQRYDLSRRSGEEILTRGRLKLPTPYSRGWISRMFAVTGDESALLCSCGLTPEGPGKVDYWLCRIEFHNQEVTLLSRFEAVNF